MKPILDMFAPLRRMYAYRREPENMRALSDVYWRTLVVVAALVVLCAILYGVTQLVGVMGYAQEGNAATPVSAAGINRTQLEATLSAFSARQENYDALASTSVSAVDPSIAL